MFGLLVLLLGLASAMPAAARDTGFLDRSITVAGRTFRYQVYVPRGWSAARRWPVILSLHGAGEYGSDGLLPTIVGLAPAVRRHPERFPAVIVFPQSRGDGPGWQGESADVALAALDRAIAEFHGDRARQYLTGYSAGGNGAWYLADRHPDRFSAALIIAGFVDAHHGGNGIDDPPIEPAGPDLYGAVARRIGRLPVWLVHGSVDGIVPVAQSRQMAAALGAAGGDVHYTELPGVDHNSWDAAYDDPAIAAWLFGKRRLPR